MTYALVPQEIVELHRALLAALRVDYFPPGMMEMNNWRDFLFVMEPLKDSTGGAFTAKDIAPAVALMRQQNKTQSSNWSLRFAKIMRDPESFRDLVLISRKAVRPRAAIETTSRTDATGAAIAVERDPAAEAEAHHISRPLREWRERMKGSNHGN
jgi:hypothetical protein